MAGDTEAAQPAVAGARYDAFISYSYAQGRLVAAALQHELERFAAPWYRPRGLRVFRDQANLAASPDLWNTIERALAGSDWLILMASPQAAQSPWVTREIGWWRANKPAERILIAVTGGEVAWAGDDFDWDRTDALPRALSGAFARQPLWVDLRPLVPGPSVPVQPDAERAVRLGDLVAEFAAPIRHAEKDALVGEHIRQRRRVRRTVRGVIAALSTLLALAVTAGVVAFVQRNEAIRQRDVANARRVVAQADAVRQQRPDLALLLAVAAQRMAPVAEARASLVETLAASRFAGLLRGHRAQVDAVAASPGGSVLATASNDGTVVLWDIGERLRPHRLATLPAGGSLDTVGFNRAGTLLAAGGLNGTLLWEVSNPAQPRVVARLDGSDAVRFSRAGDVLFAGGKLWDVATPARPVLLGSLPDELTVRDVDISEDGKTLAVAGRPNPTSLWDISRPGRPQLLARLSDRADAVALSPDGRALLLAPESGTPLLWNVADPARPLRLGALPGTTINVVFDVAFGPGGKIAATAEGDGITVWNLQDLENPAQAYRLHGHEHAVYAAEFTAQGQQLVTGGPDGVVMAWSMADPRNPREIAAIGPFDAAPEIVGFSRDDRIVFTSGSFDPVYLWDAGKRSAPTRLSAFGAPRDSLLQVDISPDNTTLISSPSKRPPTVWDIADTSRPKAVGSLGDAAGRVRFAPDGRTVVRIGLDGGADLWDLSRRDSPTRIGELGPLGEGIGSGARFSPDGRLLAVTGRDATQLWDVADPRRPVRLSSTAGMGYDVAIRADGRVLAGVSDDDVLLLWDISKPRRPIRLGSAPGENGGDSVAFTPDGQSAVTGSSDGIATVWDVSDPARPRRVGVAAGHAGSVYHVALSQDGRTLITGSYDRTVKLWDMPSIVADLRDPFAVACALAGPSISPADWRRYLGDLPESAVC